MRKALFVFCILIFSNKLISQPIAETLTGKVSFISPKNVYVKFISTEGISVGDTLFSESNGKLVPVLNVNNLSSASCACTYMAQVKFSLADKLIAFKKSGPKIVLEKTRVNAVRDSLSNSETVKETRRASLATTNSHKLRGSLSAYSYTNFSNTRAPKSTRLRYNLTLNAQNIANSKFSIESYISFNHKPGDWAPVKSDIFNALKIYSMNIKYDLNKSTQISFGRKINQKIASIGAMDGIQVEKTINKISFGVLAGTRPGFKDYGFNAGLFQYGAYIAHSNVTAASYSESSMAFMQQTNGGKTDRRFLYFQHSASILKNLYFMGTFEIDLYKLRNDSLNGYTPQSIFDLTGLYLSLRYRITNNLSLSGSYDGRKNILYYETYKSFIDRMLESGMRQSLRVQADYRLTRNISVGVQSGYRFLRSDPQQTKNINGYIFYNQIPGLNISLTLSGTYLESSYLKSKIYGATFTRDFFKGKLSTGLGYHYMDYRYPEALMNTIQNVGEVNLWWQLPRGISFSANYEGTWEMKNTYNMVFLQIRKRF